jgi:hypothetical protein
MSEPEHYEEPPLGNLKWVQNEPLTVDEGGLDFRSWSDMVSIFQAKVPGGVLVMAVRDEGPGGLGLAFVPTITAHDVADRQRTLDAIKEIG